MARKERPLKGAGNDTVDYRDFLNALLRGDIQASTLRETVRVSDGVGKLSKLEYDEPAAKGDSKVDAGASASEPVAEADSSKQT